MVIVVKTRMLWDRIPSMRGEVCAEQYAILLELNKPFRLPLNSSALLQNLCVWVKMVAETLMNAENRTVVMTRVIVKLKRAERCGDEGRESEEEK